MLNKISTYIIALIIVSASLYAYDPTYYVNISEKQIRAMITQEVPFHENKGGGGVELEVTNSKVNIEGTDIIIGYDFNAKGYGFEGEGTAIIETAIKDKGGNFYLKDFDIRAFDLNKKIKNIENSKVKENTNKEKPGNTVAFNNFLNVFNHNTKNIKEDITVKMDVAEEEYTSPERSLDKDKNIKNNLFLGKKFTKPFFKTPVSEIEKYTPIFKGKIKEILDDKFSTVLVFKSEFNEWKEIREVSAKDKGIIVTLHIKPIIFITVLSSLSFVLFLLVSIRLFKLRYNN